MVRSGVEREGRTEPATSVSRATHIQVVSSATRDQADPLALAGRCSGCWPHDGEVDGCAVEESGCGRTLELGRSRRS